MNADSSRADYQRGCHLLELKRFADAELAFRGVLAREPAHSWALHQLAFAIWRQDREAEALEVAEQAIGADPEVSLHQVLRSQVLVSLRRLDEARRAADEAVRLDPASADAFAARAQACAAKSDWAGCEEAARAALALDPEHALASHFLAHALRQLGKKHENAAVVQEQLRRDPDSPLAHANAGWAALEQGDRRRAEEHFSTALRLQPDLDWAREGLLEAFRARSPVYRTYLAYNLWMSKRRAGQQWAIIAGLWIGVRFARVLFTGHLRWLGLCLAAAYLAFVFWVWVARGVGNLLLLSDRFGRMVLRPSEKREAIFVGGGLFLGVIVATAGFVLPSGLLLTAGLAWAFAAIPLACTFDNSQPVGRWLFGAAGALGWAVALVSLSALVLPRGDAFLALDFTERAFPVALIAAVATTWLGNVPWLRRRR